MSNIHVMSDILASQVAAGEVVERPASVIKELVENSLDAGARTITVEITRGGTALIKVTDDGSGMSREDALLCLQRHATSKLMDLDGLFAIHHLGFRGEALPSIASVSRLKLSTREKDALEGCELNIHAGIPEEPKSSGISPGTCIEVHELFYNTPARRKFLKSQETESAHVEHQLRLHALAFPEVRFIFRKDGQTVFDLPGTHDLQARIAALTDHRTADALITIPETIGTGLTATGYLLPLSEARRNKKGQFVFLNHRPIDDQLVGRAIRDGFGGFPSGLHPALYLYLEVEPALVDVNVHPAKKEVRFRRPSDIVSCVIEAISSALSSHARADRDPEISESIKPPKAAEEIQEPPPAPPHQQPVAVLQAEPAPGKKIPTPLSKKEPSIPSSAHSLQPPPRAASPAGALRPLPAAQSHLPLERPQPAPLRKSADFHYLGSLNATYALFENNDGLVLLHPRAARERIIFEELMKHARQGIKSQALLDPVMLELDPRDFAVLNELAPHFEQAGINMSPFGQRTMRVESLPAMLHPENARSFILELIDRITDTESGKKAGRLTFEAFSTELAQKSSRSEKINFSLSPDLLERLLNCEVPYCTPSGKPTMTMFSMAELARKFNLPGR